MQVKFKNNLYLTEKSLNIPFLIEESTIGYISEIAEDSYTVEIFDRFLGCEILDGVVSAVYLSANEQLLGSEFMKALHKK